MVPTSRPAPSVPATMPPFLAVPARRANCVCAWEKRRGGECKEPDGDARERGALNRHNCALRKVESIQRCCGQISRKAKNALKGSRTHVRLTSSRSVISSSSSSSMASAFLVHQSEKEKKGGHPEQEQKRNRKREGSHVAFADCAPPREL